MIAIKIANARAKIFQIDLNAYNKMNDALIQQAIDKFNWREVEKKYNFIGEKSLLYKVLS